MIFFDDDFTIGSLSKKVLLKREIGKQKVVKLKKGLKEEAKEKLMTFGERRERVEKKFKKGLKETPFTPKGFSVRKKGFKEIKNF